MIYVVFGCAVMLAFSSIALLQELVTCKREVIALKARLPSKDLEIDLEILGVRQALNMQNTFNPFTASEPSFDKTTKDLIRLAANNPNENEARNAAIKVCKRLANKL